ncbi:DciA family protein [Emcibacter sp. SYSU 3D8]|uniref:DUF721 domain-containing protein n=1 Tax=Emcibacter sp. SYSU 3D8 TaxID=3133969 RepID=UPI0031FE4721
MTNKRSGHGPRRFGDLARPLLSPALRKQGFAQNEIVTRWRDVVGALLASRSMPERLRFPQGERIDGVLFIRVESSFALEFQHLTPQILEKVNTFYGYRAVAKLVMKQGPIPRAAPRPSVTVAALPAETEAGLARSLDTLKPGPLKEALGRLGRRILADGKA